ncbi:MAG: 4a-hydroxytetrahydrobiopterin dehydratase [Planctomycetaceae bacterium]|nr:4a-hydroxytetrahydrobiopterin dehydratase [Planctomycetaceae bacterium]
MNAPQSLEQLCTARCVPCEGGVPRLTADEIAEQIKCLPQWEFVSGPDRIRRTWKVRNFVAAMDFFQKICVIAEEQAHHPDLHLVQYRNVTVEIWTHAIQGLSLNDFILAAQIDRIAVS